MMTTSLSISISPPSSSSSISTKVTETGEGRISKTIAKEKGTSIPTRDKWKKDNGNKNLYNTSDNLPIHYGMFTTATPIMGAWSLQGSGRASGSTFGNCIETEISTCLTISLTIAWKNYACWLKYHGGKKQPASQEKLKGTFTSLSYLNDISHWMLDSSAPSFFKASIKQTRV